MLSARKVILTQTAWSGLSSILTMIVMLISSAGILVLYGPDQAAEVAYLLWLAGSASAVSSLGFPYLLGPLTAGMVASTGQVRRVPLPAVATSLTISVLSLVLGAGLGYALAPGGDPLPDAIGAGLLALGLTAHNASGGMLAGALRNEILAGAAGIQLLVLVAILVLARGLPIDPSMAVAVAYASRALVLAMLLRTGITFESQHGLKAEVTFGELISAYGLGIFMFFAVGRIEVFFLNLRADSAQVSAYVLAADLSLVIRGLPSALLVTLVPILAGMFRTSEEAARTFVLEIATLASAFLVALFTLLALILPYLHTVTRLDLEFGGYTSILFAAGLLSSCGTIVAQYFAVQRRMVTYFLATLLSGLLVFVLNLFFTKSLQSAVLSQLGGSFAFLLFLLLNLGATAEVLMWKMASFILCAALIVFLPLAPQLGWFGLASGVLFALLLFRLSLRSFRIVRSGKVLHGSSTAEFDHLPSPQ